MKDALRWRATSPNRSSRHHRRSRIPTGTIDDSLVRRIRAEFLEMPGLRLSLTQAQRLWMLERATCEAVLDALVDNGFLYRTNLGLYALRPERTAA